MTEPHAETLLAFPSALTAEGQPEVHRVLAYWEALRGPRPMPERDEIDPRAIAPALEHLFLAEAVTPQVVRLRLAGQHLAQLLGMEPRGMPLSALFEPAARAEIGLAVAQVLAHRVRALVPLRAERGLIRPGLRGLMALMPLADGQGGTRILGVIEMQGMIGRAPRRLMVNGPLDSAGGLPALPREGAAPRLGPGRPALRVIAGGRDRG